MAPSSRWPHPPPWSTNGWTPTGWCTSPIKRNRAPRRFTPQPQSSNGVNLRSPGAAPGSQPAKPATGALNLSAFAITSPVPDQTFFAEDVVAVHLAVAPELGPDQVITWHLNGKELTSQPPDAMSFALQGTGSRCLRNRRHGHRSKDRTIADYRERHFLCAPAVHVVAAVPARQVAASVLESLDARFVG